jgi:uncharacterized protein
MNARKLLEENEDKILTLAGKHGVRNVRLFGSTVRGESGPASDFDFLVDMEPGRSYLDIVAFWQDLEELLGCKADVVTEEGLSPYLRDTIMAEAVPL